MFRALKLSGVAVVALLGLTLGGTASASPIAIIDQQNDGPVDTLTGPAIPLGRYFGQSFTAGLTGIDSIDLWSRTTSTSTMRIDLLAGSGTVGPALATTGDVTFTNVAFDFVNFDFLSTIALTVGDVYTMAFVYVGGDAPLHALTANLYGGGIGFDTGNNPVPALDFIFREGLHGAAVPEPASLALLGLGLFGLGWSRRQAAH